MDRLDAMQLFVRVAELGSFAAAAQQIGVARSVVTRQIAGLEAHLGIKLMARRAGGRAGKGTGGGGWQRNGQKWKGLQVACSGVAGWWHASARQAEQQKTDGQGLSWHEQYASGRVKVHQPIGGACNSSTMPRCRAHQMLQMQAAGSSKEAAPAHLCFFYHTALQRTRIAAPVSPRPRIQQRRVCFRNVSRGVGAVHGRRG